MKFTVNTDDPTWLGGDKRNDDTCLFLKGDVVEVTRATPDHDGDVTATNLTREWNTGSGDNVHRYIALSCLTPYVEPTTAGTVSVKVTPDLDDFAALLVEKIATSLEEAAKAMRKGAEA